MVASKLRMPRVEPSLKREWLLVGGASLKAETFLPIVRAFNRFTDSMIIAITILHVIVSIGLILVVLLQTGKGAEVGAVFGGSSSTIFGSSGAGNFLTRLTTGMAIVFMLTSLTLGYFAGKKPTSTIFDNGSSVEGTAGTSASQSGNKPVHRKVSPPATGPTAEEKNPATNTEP